MSTVALPQTLTKANIAKFIDDSASLVGREVKHLKGGTGLGVTLVMVSLVFAAVISVVNPGTTLAQGSLFQMGAVLPLGIAITSVCAFMAHGKLSNEDATRLLEKELQVLEGDVKDRVQGFYNNLVDTYENGRLNIDGLEGDI